MYLLEYCKVRVESPNIILYISTAIYNILIALTLELRYSSEVTGLIREFVGFLHRGFGGKITPNVIGDKSVALNSCKLFEIKIKNVKYYQ